MKATGLLSSNLAFVILSLPLLLSHLTHGAWLETGKDIVLIGVTGAGKSTLGNTLLGYNAFDTSDELDSCTSEIGMKRGHLFGNSASAMVRVSDTGGLGDTYGRDDSFVADIASHARSNGGIGGVVYVHNACDVRLNAQAREALATMVATFTDKAGRSKLAARVAIVLTHCTRLDRRVAYKALPGLLCKDYKLCNVPMFWYDDYGTQVTFREFIASWFIHPLASVLGFSVEKTWRERFEAWVVALPTKKLQLPSETEREHLKTLHQQEIDQATKRSEACFSPDSRVIDKKRGPVMLKDLSIGTKVADEKGWTTVQTLLHWHPNKTVLAMEIVHDQGTLTLSPEHILFASNTSDGEARAIPAHEVKAGEMWLKTATNTASRVHLCRRTTMDGYYAPITSSGTLLVENVVVSSYTQHEEYKLSHVDMNILAAPLRWLPTWAISTPPAGVLHPYVRYSVALANYLSLWPIPHSMAMEE